MAIPREEIRLALINQDPEAIKKYKDETNRLGVELSNALKNGQGAGDSDSKEDDFDDSEAEALDLNAGQDPPTKKADSAAKSTEKPADGKEVKEPSTGQTEGPETETVDPVLARIELLEREIKLRDIQNEKRDIELEKWQRLARTRASEIGNLRQNRQAAPEDADLLADPTKGTKERDADDGEARELREAIAEDMVENCYHKSLAAFDASNPEMRQHIKDMQQYVTAHADEYASEFGSGNPKRVRRATDLLVREAFTAAREAKYVEELNSLKDKRQKHLADLEERKKGSSASASTSAASGGSAKPSGKRSLKDLSDDELKALITGRQ